LFRWLVEIRYNAEYCSGSGNCWTDYNQVDEGIVRAWTENRAINKFESEIIAMLSQDPAFNDVDWVTSKVERIGLI